MEKSDSAPPAAAPDFTGYTQSAPRRRGFVRLRDIPLDLLDRINRGELETATLTEQAAMDFAALLGSLEGWAGDRAALLREAAALRPGAHGIVARMRLAGEALGRCGAFAQAAALRQLMGHPADTVRGFACHAIAAHPSLAFEEKFAWIRPLAADPHFGVREWAWLALRPAVAVAPLQALNLLQGWAGEADARLRRFAVEITRPRGVWAKRILLLAAQPQLGQPLLEACRCDPSRYVQDSVANWLNDAAKSRPEWVRQLCRDWLDRNGQVSACRYIVRRAQRSMKHPDPEEEA